MAEYGLELPTELLNSFKQLANEEEKMLKEMTKAGAKVVYKNIKTNVPESFHGSEIMNCLKITKTYRTPSDDGINTKVAFYGYFNNKRGIKTPAPLVCNVFEYGRSDFPWKRPFIRQAFSGKEIEKVMLEVQNKYITKCFK